MSEGHLIDEQDLNGFIDWASDLMTNKKKTNWIDPDKIDIADGLFSKLHDELKEWVEKHVGNGTLPSPGEAGELFSTLKELADDPYEFTWGVWTGDDVELTENGRAIGYGNSKNLDLLVSTRILHTKSLIQHTYSDLPPPVKLELTALDQDGYKVYIGSATAGELDAICSVPWIDPGYTSQQFANRVYNGRMREDEWQRVVDIKRVHDIRNFASSEGNYLLNPVLLFADLSDEGKSSSIKETKKLNGKGILQVDFSFLAKRKAGWTDYVPKPGDEDTRPIWIIDGQHRVRGCGASFRGSSLPIPFVLMVGRDKEFDLDLCARIFTEINTKSVPLEALQQIYLRYKFGMKGVGSRQDFSNQPDEGAWSGRANRRAYEMALNMASSSGSPLYDMIEFQRPVNRRRPHHIAVNASNWIDYVRKWFSSGAIYSMVETDSYNEDELMNFFKAFEIICSADNWDDGRPRWDPGQTKVKPLLQFEGPFLSLLDLYPYVIARLVEGEDHPRPIPVSVFTNILKPLTNVDWINPSLRNSNLTGRTNLNIRHLVNWMFEAICHEGEYSAKEILDPSKRSLAGRGLLAAPEKSHIDVMSDVKWPTALPLVLRAEKPLHTLVVGWTVTFVRPSGPVHWDIPKTNISGNQLSILLQDVQRVANGCTSIEVSAEMKNGVGKTLTERRVFNSTE